MLTTIRSSPRSACSDDEGVPVLAGDGVDVALGRVAASGKGILLGGFVGRVGRAHEYDLL